VHVNQTQVNQARRELVAALREPDAADPAIVEERAQQLADAKRRANQE
jgi:hypothetical protein